MMLHAICMAFRWSIQPGKKITEGIATNPVTEPFAVSVNIPCMPWCKFSRVILWNFTTRLWSLNILHMVWAMFYFVQELIEASGVTPVVFFWVKDIDIS